MINLLSAEFYKLRKSKAVYIGILAAAALALLLYGSLVMIDKINQGELANGTGGVVVSQNGVEMDGSSESMLLQIGVVGVLLFSTTLTAGLDLVFYGMGMQLSKYWVLDLLASCPITDFTSEFLMRGVLVSVVWFVTAAALGVVHFLKSDVK